VTIQDWLAAATAWDPASCAANMVWENADRACSAAVDSATDAASTTLLNPLSAPSSAVSAASCAMFTVVAIVRLRCLNCDL
jgi:hypothetical protein